ncbi:MAG: HEAT repeat domain-containing protein [Pirellulales bacterium]
MSYVRPSRHAPGSISKFLSVALLLLVAPLAVGCRRSPTELVSKGYPTPEEVVELRHRFDLAMATPEEKAELTSAAAEPIALVREATVGEIAADSLARIGTQSVPALVQGLRDANPHVRELSAQALARMGPDAESSVPELIAALHDPDPEVQRSAARALGQIGPEAASAIPALMEAIRRDLE